MTIITNNEIATALNISARSVTRKRNGGTNWTLTEYLKLIEVYGDEIAGEIVQGGCKYTILNIK